VDGLRARQILQDFVLANRANRQKYMAVDGGAAEQEISAEKLHL
jgi:hypothetical protein